MPREISRDAKRGVGIATQAYNYLELGDVRGGH